MWILIPNVDNMKAFLDVPDELKLNYCMLILEDNASVQLNFLCLSYLSTTSSASLYFSSFDIYCNSAII